MAYTIKELDAAIMEVLYWSGVRLTGRDRIVAHRDACAKALIEGIDGRAADVLREAHRDLEKTDAYQPSDGLFPDDA
jgi:hypothetical protein